MNALKGLAIRKIVGYNYLGEYLLFGFEVLDYRPKYPITEISHDSTTSRQDNL